MMAGQMVSSGAHYILTIGQADGKSFLEQEAITFQLADTAISSGDRKKLISQEGFYADLSPGF